jgi:hypothetical protein
MSVLAETLELAGQAGQLGHVDMKTWHRRPYQPSGVQSDRMATGNLLVSPSTVAAWNAQASRCSVRSWPHRVWYDPSRSTRR